MSLQSSGQNLKDDNPQQPVVENGSGSAPTKVLPTILPKLEITTTATTSSQPKFSHPQHQSITSAASLAVNLAGLSDAAQLSNTSLPLTVPSSGPVASAVASQIGPEAVAAATATWQLMQQALVGGLTSGQVNSQPLPGFIQQLQQSSMPGTVQQVLQQISSSHQPKQPPSMLPHGALHPQVVSSVPIAPIIPHPASSLASLAATSSSSEPPVPALSSSGEVAAQRITDKKRKAEPLNESRENKPAKSRNAFETSMESSSSFSLDALVPPQPKTDAEVARMTPAERRRYERNLREQQRSYRISQQIKELRDVLAESNVPYKPNKFSILVSVTEYIKQLQSRAIMLDAEQQKLVTTISQSSNLVPPPSSLSEDSEKDASSLQSYCVENDPDLLLVQGIDYKSIFGRCPFAVGVSSLDGRVLACNEAFEKLLGCEQREMIDQSLFLYIRNHQELFEAMADLLKRSSLGSETRVLPSTEDDDQLLFWCGSILSQTAQRLHFTITLTTTPDSNPKYFSFSASPAAASPVS